MRRQRPLKKRLVIGLTGSFGSGKSTVARFFRSFGARLLDADAIARGLLLPGRPAYKKVVSAFGRQVLKKNGEIDRRRLGKEVFLKRDSLKRLNRIMHPPVIRAIKQGLRGIPAGKIAVIDAPLLIEAGLDRITDKLVVVETARREQLARLIRKTHLGRKEILARIKSQMPLSRKLRLADFIIDNGGSLRKTKEQAQEIWRFLWKS